MKRLGASTPNCGLRPAHQRLHADQRARAQIDLRLVVQKELLALERVTQTVQQ
jgi:hypothetical protein